MRTKSILLFVLLLVASASAEFAAYGEQSIDLQPCSNTIRNVTIQNTGTEIATYELSVDGDGADFVTFGTLSFTLQQGQFLNVPVFYAIPCTTEPDTYPLSIYFSDGETELELAQDIVVLLTETLNVTTTATSIVNLPCQKTVFNFTLHNPSNFTELYTIEASGRADLSLSEEKTVAMSGQRKTITLAIEPEDCTEHGTYPLEVTFESEKSAHSQTFNLEYIITPTDIPDLARETTRIKTDYIDSTTDLSIKNLGDRTSAYTLSFEGTSWGSIAPAKITLAPGEERKVTLRLVPPAETPSGQYPVSFVARVDQTGITYSKEFVLLLARPSFAELNPGLFAGISLAIIIILVLFVLIVRHVQTEKFKREYSVWKERRAIKKARKAQARVASQALREKHRKEREEKRARAAEKQKHLKEQARVQAEREFRKEYRLVAHKEIVSGAPLRSKSQRGFIWIIFLAIIALLVIGTWDYLAPNFPFVIAGIILVALLMLFALVRRTRTARRHFRLLLPEQTTTVHAWKRGLTQLAISPEQATKNFIVVVSKTKTRVKPSPFVYQTFQLRENAEAKTIATFAIPKRLLEKNGVKLENLRIARYTQQSWKTVSYEKTGEDTRMIFLRSELKPGTHSIFFKKIEKKPCKWPHWIMGLVGIALLILVVTALYDPAVTGVIPPQTWKKDTVRQFDLSPYFTDPDSDALTFSAQSTPPNIAIDVLGSMATFTPRVGWTGQEQARFTADDKRGGKITSNPVILTVRDQIVPPPVRSGILVLLALAGAALVVQAVRRLRKYNSGTK
ncbi:MAG TPA: hypothetical protein VJJ82_06045 [Candidatus Nanoarchaeia archaeon]|nr:hypothetical protein [Candidatus Nanoarchaeia archaeon]